MDQLIPYYPSGKQSKSKYFTFQESEAQDKGAEDRYVKP